MYYAGDFDMTDTVYIAFNTFTSDDPSASSTITDLADGDIHIHKDGSTTQRASGSGVTVAANFDTITGNHLVSIDLTDNTDAGYYATGSTYLVRMEGTTVDAATINAWIGQFSIGRTRAAIRTEVGLAGSSLTAIPWNASWDAEVQSEVEDGIAAGTALVSIPWNAAWDAEVQSEVEDGIGAGTALVSIPWNAAWDAEVESEVQDVVGLAGSSLTAVVWNAAWDAEVESEVIDGIAAGTALVSIPWNAAWDAEVQSEVEDGIAAGTALVSIPWNSAWDAEVESEVVDVVGLAGSSLTAVVWNADWDAEVESEVTDSLVAHNLDHLALTATGSADMTTEVADNTILSRILANGDTSAFVPSTDGLQPIRDAITDANPISHAATANNETTGTLDSGTYADTASINNTYYQVSPAGAAVGGFGLNVDLTFGIGVGRVPSTLQVTGYFDSGAQRTVQVWAYDYNTAAYVQLSNSINDFGNAGANQSYQYSMTANMVKVSDGEVKVRFTSTSITTGDDYYLDYLNINSVAQEASGLTANQIQQAVWARVPTGHDENTLGYTLGHVHVLKGDLSSATSTTQFIIDSGVAANDAYNGMVIMMEDETDEHYEVRRIVDYIGATNEVFLDRALGFTPAAGDHYYIMATGYADINVTHVSGSAQSAVDIGGRIGAGGSSLTAIPGLPYGIQKNTALPDFEFLMVNSAGSAQTGLTVAGYRSVDGGAFGSAAGTIAEVSNGIYQFDALAADTNGDLITWRFVATGAQDTFTTFKTES